MIPLRFTIGVVLFAFFGAAVRAALVEISGEGVTVVAGSFDHRPLPEYLDAPDQANHLKLTAVFDTKRRPVARTATTAEYEALYGYGQVNDVLLPLQRIRLRLVLHQGFECSFEISGKTADGAHLWIYGYSEDPQFIASLDFPVNGFSEPADEFYRRVDIGMDGSHWYAVTDQTFLPEVSVFSPVSSGKGPEVRKQPKSVKTKKGSSTKLDVQVSSRSRVTYQWYKDGLPLLGENGPKLFLKKTRSSVVGWYWVVATNDKGSTGSKLARVELR